MVLDLISHCGVQAEALHVGAVIGVGRGLSRVDGAAKMSLS